MNGGRSSVGDFRVLLGFGRQSQPSEWILFDIHIISHEVGLPQVAGSSSGEDGLPLLQSLCLLALLLWALDFASKVELTVTWPTYVLLGQNSFAFPQLLTLSPSFFCCSEVVS